MTEQLSTKQSARPFWVRALCNHANQTPVKPALVTVMTVLTLLWLLNVALCIINPVTYGKSLSLSTFNSSTVKYKGQASIY